jgi:hypothetical protein
MPIGCFRALPFFDHCEMIRSHRVLQDIESDVTFFFSAGFG